MEDTRVVDVLFHNKGSIIMVEPVTDKAKTWVDANVAGEPEWFGPRFACEHRAARTLADGMIAAGLTCA